MNWTYGCRGALIALVPAALALQGCVAPLLVGGAAVGGAVVGTDRRSAGIQLEDHHIESHVESALNDRIPKHAMNVEVVSYDRKVLLTGEVRTAEYKAQASEAASHVENVREVFNELSVAEPASFSARSDDAYVESKVKAVLLGADGVPTGVVMTTVNQGMCYLMGKVTASEGEAAATAASRVGGVRRVVKLFEVIDAREAAEIRKERTPPPPPGSPPDASAAGH